MIFTSSWLRLAGALALLTTAGACTSKTSDPAPEVFLATTTWTVDGTAAGTHTVLADATANGALSLVATARLSPTTSASIEHTVDLLLPGRVGTFALPAAARARYYTFDGATSQGQQYAATSGTVTISSYVAGSALGASHVVGTFAFALQALPGSTGTLTIASGSFDVIF